MKSLFRILPLAAACALIAGCSGSAGGITPFADSGAVRAARMPGGKAHLTVRIRIPRHHRRRRHAHYVSAGTKGLTLTFSGPATLTAAVGLTPSSPNCSGSPTTCTIDLTLAAGSYRATVVAYDAAPVNGAIPPSAHVLSTASNVPATVVTGAANVLGFTLDGVPATITLKDLPVGIAGAGFIAKPFTVDALDASGFTIVGTYATPVALNDADSYGATGITTSGSDDPPAGKLLSSGDTASLSYTGQPTAPIAITASAGGATGSAYFKVVNAIAVADAGNQALKVAPPGCLAAVCVITIGTYNITGVAVDGKGDVYWSNATRGEVDYAIPCSSGYCEGTVAAGSLSNLKGFALDSAATHVYAASGSDVLAMAMGCNYSGCQTNLAPGAFLNPTGVAVDTSGNLFVADPTLGEVLKIPAGCSIASCVVQMGGTAFVSPEGVAVDDAGSVYVADSFGSVLKMPDSCQASGCVAPIGAGFLEPYGVAVDPFGDVMVADYAQASVIGIPPGCTDASCEFKWGSGFKQAIGVATQP